MKIRIYLSFLAIFLLHSCVAFAYEIPFVVGKAIEKIESTYGDRVKIKQKTLAKFGKNDVVGTSYATLMTMPSGQTGETFVASNLITHVSSSNGSDTQSVVVEGQKLVGSSLVFVVQSTTLTGQTKAALTTPLYRITRLYNDNSTEFSGVIYGFEDDTLVSGVPQTNTKVHIMVPSGQNQSFKAATSLSNQDYWIITSVLASVNEKTSASVDIELQIREYGKVFRTIFQASVGSIGANSVIYPLDPAIIAPKNSDIRVRAKASTSNVSASARLSGYLALVQN